VAITELHNVVNVLL